MVKMASARLLFLLVSTFAGAYSEKDPEADFHKLPKLFHLDDYERCLEKKDGVYCLGQFDIYSDVHPNPLYDLIQEKSQDIRLFNRSYLHRGYCLPTRCADAGGEANATARFERCVDAWARGHSLRARLHTLHYCRASGKLLPYEEKITSTPHRVFLYVIYAILFMNFIGTVYDFKWKKNQKNPTLMAFSLRVNWQSLRSMVDDHEDDLQIIYGIRSMMIFFAIYAHVGVIVPLVYQHNPRFIEKFLSSPAGPMLGSLTTVTQHFILMSNFLTAYNLLQLSKKYKIGLRKIPVLILKRIIRVWPLYLLVNAYAATWWTSAGDGPMWPLVVGTESDICQKKFWVTSAFLQNLIDPEHFCLVQTWIIAADMQIHVVTLVVVILLLKRRQWAIPVLSLLFVGATALTAHVAIKNQYIPALYYMTPEFFRQKFQFERNFNRFFITPINCAMLAVAGVLVAFLYEDHKARGVKIGNSKILVFLHYISMPLVFAWAFYCSIIRETITDPLEMTLLVPIERVIVSGLCAFILYSMINLKTPLESVFGWKCLRVFMRLSFSVSMVHWCVNLMLVANRQTLHDSSMLGMVLDCIGTWVISNLIAVPLTIMVEYPFQKILDRLIIRRLL